MAHDAFPQHSPARRINWHRPVTPAADLPRTAKNYGARLVIINRDATTLDSCADAIFKNSIGEVLTAVDAALNVGKTN